MDGTEFWRYEIWWKFKTYKTKKDKYLIDELRVQQLEEDGGIFNRLFEDKIQLKKQQFDHKRYWKKRY
ncbi:MAG: hypothetical protein ACQEXX_00015 [Bacillota bacterium]